MRTFKQHISEKRKVTSAQIQKFAQMTDQNQHTEVRLQIAKIVGDRALIKKYENPFRVIDSGMLNVYSTRKNYLQL